MCPESEKKELFPKGALSMGTLKLDWKCTAYTATYWTTNLVTNSDNQLVGPKRIRWTQDSPPPGIKKKKAQLLWTKFTASRRQLTVWHWIGDPPTGLQWPRDQAGAWFWLNWENAQNQGTASTAPLLHLIPSLAPLRYVSCHTQLHLEPRSPGDYCAFLKLYQDKSPFPQADLGQSPRPVWPPARTTLSLKPPLRTARGETSVKTECEVYLLLRERESHNKETRLHHNRHFLSAYFPQS